MYIDYFLTTLKLKLISWLFKVGNTAVIKSLTIQNAKRTHHMWILKSYSSNLILKSTKVHHPSIMEDQAQNESTPLLENGGQNSSSDQPSRSARVRKWALGSFMAILASFTYTWYNYFIKTFQQQASDVLLVKATSSLVIFGSLVLFQKQDVWPRIERCESVRQYWLQGFLLIFQVRIT